MNLNIIGNGFDLYHGLPSSYYYFGCYLVENNCELYDELSEMYGFRKGVNSGFPSDDFYYAVEDFFWKDFEIHLGEINSLWVDESLQDDLGLENDDAVDLDMYQYNNSDEIKKALSRWMNNIVDKEENYKIIREKMKTEKFKLNLSKKDYYLSFNYTHTLEKIYRIDENKIYHIHGECTESVEDNLIIGHGNDRRINEIKRDIEKFEGNDFEQASRNRENELKCICYNLTELRKDVAFCIKESKRFFNRIVDKPDKIQVYGLSLGDVDIPYLVYIRERWPDAKWRFSYYFEDQKTNIYNIAEKYLKLPKEQYELFEFCNTFYQDIQESIVFLQKIEKVNKI
jgi:hypothetical protein